MPDSVTGILYVVATPIGNLNDITHRALTILKDVSYIACEDTRRTQILLNHFGIKSPLLVLQDHNEREVIERYVTKIKEGASMALVSDAGTPLVSDPGFRLVAKAQAEGIKVVPIPGACAAIAALSAWGLPCDRFYFYGFLPAKKEARSKELLRLKSQAGTVVFYEAPHRLEDSLQDMVTVLGEDCLGGVAREITKQFEQIINAPLGELLAKVQSGEIVQKGECVLAVCIEEIQAATTEIDKLIQLLLVEIPAKSVVKIVQSYFDLPKNEVYAKVLAVQKGLGGANESAY